MTSRGPFQPKTFYDSRGWLRFTLKSIQLQKQSNFGVYRLNSLLPSWPSGKEHCFGISEVLREEGTL